MVAKTRKSDSVCDRPEEISPLLPALVPGRLLQPAQQPHDNLCSEPDAQAPDRAHGRVAPAPQTPSADQHPGARPRYRAARSAFFAARFLVSLPTSLSLRPWSLPRNSPEAFCPPRIPAEFTSPESSLY